MASLYANGAVAAGWSHNQPLVLDELPLTMENIERLREKGTA